MNISKLRLWVFLKAAKLQASRLEEGFHENLYTCLNIEAVTGEDGPKEGDFYNSLYKKEAEKSNYGRFALGWWSVDEIEARIFALLFAYECLKSEKAAKQKKKRK